MSTNEPADVATLSAEFRKSYGVGCAMKYRLEVSRAKIANDRQAITNLLERMRSVVADINRFEHTVQAIYHVQTYPGKEIVMGDLKVLLELISFLDPPVITGGWRD